MGAVNHFMIISYKYSLFIKPKLDKIFRVVLHILKIWGRNATCCAPYPKKSCGKFLYIKTRH